MSARLITLLAGVIAIAAIAVGCGGSNDDATTAGSGSGETTASSEETSTGDSETAAASITKAQLIAKADAICTKGGEEAQAELSTYVKENQLSESKEPTAAQFAEIAEEILVPALQKQAGEIRALGAPAGDEAEVEAIVGALDEGIEKVDDDPETGVKSTSTVLAKADKLLTEYGFKVCGQAGG